MRYVAFLAVAARRLFGRALRPLRRFLRRRRTNAAVGGGQAASQIATSREAGPAWDPRDVPSVPDTFVLYRILGNDLPPRHRDGQSLRNLRFLLENEPDLPGCEKRYVVNRIVDPDVERQLLDLLAEHDASVLHLPFHADECRCVGWRVADFRRPGMLYGLAHETLPRIIRARVIDHAYHDKNLYVMNNNGARNAALEDGRSRATWVLPFDGNCFFTASGWDELRRAVLARPHLRYALVPMARVNDNEELLDTEFRPEPREEPQVVFRFDAQETFDADQRYGRRPKVSLLRRLEVPGPWDSWSDEEWESSRSSPSPEAGAYQEAGWIARLASGEPQLESSDHDRMMSRMTAIRRCLEAVDEQVLRERFDPSALHARCDELLLGQREALTARPELVSQLGLDHSATGSIPASPNSRGFNTLARRTAETALRAWLLGDEASLGEAAANIRQCLVDQDRFEPAPPRRHPWLLRDLDQLLDAVRLVDRAGLLDDEARATIAGWVSSHRDWLMDSRRGRRARRSLGPAGTWFEVQVAACHAYLDDAAGMIEGLRRMAARRHDQFCLVATSGRVTRRRRAIYSGANLSGWLRLAALIERLGVTLESDPSNGQAALDAALEAHLRKNHSPDQARLLRYGLGGLRGIDPATPEMLAGIDLRRVQGTPPLWWAGAVTLVRQG